MARGLGLPVGTGLIGAASAALILALAPVAAADDGVSTTTAATSTTATTTAAATTAASTTTGPTTTTGAPPCVGAGVLAIVAPPGGVPVPAGPAISTAERTGVEAASFADPGGSLRASTVQVGGAGCRDVTGTPGGTSVSTGAWSVLGGAVSGDALSADLVPSPTAPGSGWTLRAKVTGLRIGGHEATLEAGQSLPVGAWGSLGVQGRLDAGAGQPLRWWASALELRLTAAHAGLPAGTTLLIGYASADRVAEAPPPAPTTSTTTTSTTTIAAAAAPNRGPKAAKVVKTNTTKPARHKAKKKARAKTGQPLKVTPGLGEPTYDFPVYGQVDWGDTYGGPRSDVPGGWHHGDDLFASLGRPVVAVADGTVFAVGWNGVGGWRLWLRDDAGNEFYYAHLSGYTKLARNGAHVRRGEVLGFVGNTGDAFTTPDHLHFEIHPAGLLYLGYDGAVDPSSYLEHWQRASRVAKLLPVALPDRAHHGDGALSDYRQLLALHGLMRGVAQDVELLPAVPLIPSKPLLPTERLAAPVSASAPGGSSGIAAGAAGGAAVLALAGLFGVLRKRRMVEEAGTIEEAP